MCQRESQPGVSHEEGWGKGHYYTLSHTVFPYCLSVETVLMQLPAETLVNSCLLSALCSYMTICLHY